MVKSNLILRLILIPVWGDFALGSSLMLMGIVYLNFHEPLSKCSPSDLNEFGINWQMLKEKGTHSGKLELLIKNLKMALPDLEL